MAEQFQITSEQRDGIPVITVVGYLAQEAGMKLQELFDILLSRQQTAIVLDLSRTTTINSPGVAALFDATVKVVEECRGRLVLTGINSFQERMLEMVGITRLAAMAGSVGEAVKMARG